MKKVLFCMEQLFDATKPERGLSALHYSVIGTLDSLEMGYPLTFYHDRFRLKNPEARVSEIDERLVRRCEELRPDMMMATHIIQIGVERNIKAETYEYIRDELKIPVVMLWLESAPDVVRHADMLASSVTLSIFADTKDEWRKHAKHPEKYVHLLEPRDATLFKPDPKIERDIPVSFVGSLLGRKDRAMNLAILTASGIPWAHFGGQANATQFLSIFDYVRILQRSLVTINFTSAISFRHINARVAEATLCGAMLLQSEDSETSVVLEPFLEYVPFKEIFSVVPSLDIVFSRDGDLLVKTIHYAYEHQRETRRIAEMGHSKAVEKFDGREFWKSVFDLAGVA